MGEVSSNFHACFWLALRSVISTGVFLSCFSTSRVRLTLRLDFRAAFRTVLLFVRIVCLPWQIMLRHLVANSLIKRLAAVLLGLFLCFLLALWPARVIAVRGFAGYGFIAGPTTRGFCDQLLHSELVQ